MNSKDYQILVDRLEKEIQKLRDMKRDSKNARDIEICDDYIKYHNEIINFVKRLDKEVYEDAKN